MRILRTDVFQTRESWQDYAVNALQTVERLAKEFGIEKHLHLWPDKSLGSQALANRLEADIRFRIPHSAFDIQAWLEHWWQRGSEWPT